MLHQERVRVMRARAQALADGVREDKETAAVVRFLCSTPDVDTAVLTSVRKLLATDGPE